MHGRETLTLLAVPRCSRSPWLLLPRKVLKYKPTPPTTPPQPCIDATWGAARREPSRGCEGKDRGSCFPEFARGKSGFCYGAEALVEGWGRGAGGLGHLFVLLSCHPHPSPSLAVPREKAEAGPCPARPCCHRPAMAAPSPAARGRGERLVVSGRLCFDVLKREHLSKENTACRRLPASSDGSYFAPGTLPRSASFQGLQVGEELLRWHSEEVGGLPSEKHTGGMGGACVCLVQRLPTPAGGFPQAWR